MDSWRQTGIVQDSDDETVSEITDFNGDSYSQIHPSSGVSTSQKAQSISSRTLRLPASPTPNGTTQLTIESEALVDVQLGTASSRNDSLSIEGTAISANQQESRRSAPARTLRRRNLRQLYPYKVDNEHHRRAFLAHGLKPIKLTSHLDVIGAPKQGTIPTGAQHNDSEQQEQIYSDPEDVGSNTSGQASSSAFVTPPNLWRSNRWTQSSEDPLPLQFCSEDTELIRVAEPLPTITISDGVQLIGRQPASTSGTPLHSSGRTPAATKSIVDSAIHLQFSEQLEHVSASSLPTSPIRLRTITRRPVFFMPPDIESKNIPATGQSNLKNVEANTARDPSDDEPDSSPPLSTPFRTMGRKRLLRVADSPSSSDGSSCEMHLRRAQKRIKGVLPASWMRLETDSFTKCTKPAAQHPTVTGISQRPQKGIAKRIRSRPESLSGVGVVGEPEFEDNVAVVEGAIAYRSDDHFVHLPDTNQHAYAETANNIRKIRGEISKAGKAGVMEPMVQSPLVVTSSMIQSRTKSDDRECHKPNIQALRANYGDARTSCASAGSFVSEAVERTRKRRTTMSGSYVFNSESPSSNGNAFDPALSTTKSIPAFLRIANRTERNLRRRTNKPQKDSREYTDGHRSDQDVPVVPYEGQEFKPPQEYFIPSDRLVISSSPESLSVPGHACPPLSLSMNAPFRRKTTEVSFQVSGNLRQLLMSQRGATSGKRERAARCKEVASSSRVQKRRMPSKRFRPSSHTAAWTVARSAQLEQLESEFDRSHKAVAFTRGLRKLDRQHETSPSPFRKTVPISQPSCSSILEQNPNDRSVESPELVPAVPMKHKFVAQRRQRSVELVQGIEQLGAKQTEAPQQSESACNGMTYLEGLAQHGSKYSTNFDAKPMRSSFFAHNTFIGSGEFDRALHLGARNFHEPSGTMVMVIDGHSASIGPWNEEVGTHFQHLASNLLPRHDILLRPILESSSSQDAFTQLHALRTFLRSLIYYHTAVLTFLTKSEKQSWLACALALLDRLELGVQGWLKAAEMANQSRSLGIRLVITGASYGLVFANQVYQLVIAGESGIASKERILRHVRQYASVVARILCGDMYGSLQNFPQSNEDPTTSDGGIREESLSLEAIVILSQLLESIELPGYSFWEVVADALPLSRIGGLCNVQDMDRIWAKLFAFLPFRHFDAQGILRPKTAVTNRVTDWIIVKNLLSRVFELYSATAKKSAATLNSYVRTLLTRCYILVSTWGWVHCESVLFVVFDFYARNSFQLLLREEDRGSAAFLNCLDQPDMRLLPGDVSFHIFLKLVGTVLVEKEKCYPEKKIASIVNRLMPNHGRHHNREEDLLQRDLSALRNHHELLATLYFACPSARRSVLRFLRQLVDFGSSHREVCRLSIRCWTNLVRFQLSCDPCHLEITAFTGWHNEMSETSLLQYQMALNSAQELVQGASRRSSRRMDIIVRNNQGQAAATLEDLMIALKTAVQTAPSLPAATALLRSSSMTGIFRHLEASSDLLYPAAMLVFDIIELYAGKLTPKSNNPEEMTSSEDSQDFGDWSDVEKLTFVPLRSEDAEAVYQALQDSLGQLLSNCLGADKPLQASLLQKIGDAWSATTSALVRIGVKEWSDYVDPNGSHSLHFLRDNTQKRYLLPYLLASIIENDPRAYQANRASILKSWLISLVELEPLLQWQHRLTAAIANTHSEEDVMRDAPFVADPQSGEYQITLQELRERRLVLISAILKSMNRSFTGKQKQWSVGVDGCERTYSGLLKEVMTAMKRNYQDSADGAAEVVTYIDFVHRVVQLFKQYVADYCNVDEFFSDPRSFPLPVEDPTYMVGRLRAYELRINDPGNLRKLSMFLQVSFEQAVTDGGQEFLVSQLTEAISQNDDDGSSNKRFSLRPLCVVIMKAILPVYVRASFNTPASWMLAKPALHIYELFLRRLVFQLDVSSKGASDAAVAVLSAILDSVKGAVLPLLGDPGLLEQGSVLDILVSVFGVLEGSLVPLQYIQRRTGRLFLAHDFISFFQQFGLFVVRAIDRHGDQDTPELLEDDLLPCEDDVHRSLTRFCAEDLAETLGKHWVVHKDHYQFVRRGERRAIRVETPSWEVIRARFLERLDSFLMALDGSYT